VVVKFSEDVLEIVGRAVEKYPNDVDRSVKYAEPLIRDLPEFESIMNQLITQAIRELIHNHRHTQNTAMRKETGDCHSKPKVNNASETIRKIERDYYNYYIGGKTLGMIRGSELKDIAASEREIAGGHIFNAELCEALQPLVGDSQMVQSAVSKSKLKEIWNRVQRRRNNAA